MSSGGPSCTAAGSLAMYCFRDDIADENCYVLVPEGASEAWVFDPGFQTDAVLAWMRDLHLRTEIIAFTMARIDSEVARKPVQHSPHRPIKLLP